MSELRQRFLKFLDRNGGKVGITTIILGLLLVYQYGFPKYREIQLGQLELEKSTRELTVMEKFKSTHGDYEQQFEQASQKLSKLKQVVRDGKELSSLGEKLTQRAFAAEVKIRELKLIKSVQPRPGTKGKSPEAGKKQANLRRLQLVFAGNFAKIKHYIGELEAEQLYLENLKITGEQNGNCIVVSCKVKIPVF